MIDSKTFPDKAFREYVAKFDTDRDGMFSDEEIVVVDKIDVSGEHVSQLSGIEIFTALTQLNCSNTSISTASVTYFDLSKNIALTHLECHDTNINTLDLSNNFALTYLDCRNCGSYMLNIDISHNTALTYLDCSNNQDLRWMYLGNNNQLSTLYCDNTSQEIIDIRGCPNLNRSAFRHDEGVRIIDNTTHVDGIEICGLYFPDDDFRSYISLHFDTDKNNVLTDEEIAAAKAISLPYKHLWYNLRGIEFFTSLTYL
ncbi:MAG: hypothetical protein IJS28_05390 [Synergistaceae bacterium]|nr:hypothetical protein [Synergistaceae bacterium]